MAYDAFISYRRSDRITADGVARFLEAFGLTAFVDRRSQAGAEWEPELLATLESARVLVVLWSRSAAASGWVKKEWQSVSPTCRVVPLRLDSAPLPDELNRLTVVEGLDVGTRLLQRTFELMQQQRMSPSDAQAQLVKELADDGVVLEPKQRDALGIFLGFLAGLATVALGSGLTGPATKSDSEAPTSASISPPPSAPQVVRLSSAIGGGMLAGVAALIVGYVLAPSPLVAPPLPEKEPLAAAGQSPPPVCPPLPACPSAAAVPSVAPCPQAPNCARLERALELCQDREKKLGAELDKEKAALDACRNPNPRSSTTLTRTGRASTLATATPVPTPASTLR